MSDLTLKDIEQLLDRKLDEKLKPIKNGVAQLATSEELKDVSATITAVKDTVDRHTGMLATLATDVKTVLDEKTVSVERFERLERWAERAGEKLGIKLEL